MGNCFVVCNIKSPYIFFLFWFCIELEEVEWAVQNRKKKILFSLIDECSLDLNVYIIIEIFQNCCILYLYQVSVSNTFWKQKLWTKYKIQQSWDFKILHTSDLRIQLGLTVPDESSSPVSIIVSLVSFVWSLSLKRVSPVILSIASFHFPEYMFKTWHYLHSFYSKLIINDLSSCCFFHCNLPLEYLGASHVSPVTNEPITELFMKYMARLAYLLSSSILIIEDILPLNYEMSTPE